MATELAGHHEAAAQWYEIVIGTDEAFTSAAFGLARCRRELGDPRGSIRAYQRVPESSNSYVQARVLEVELLLENGSTSMLDDALAAADIVESTTLDPRQRASLSANAGISVRKSVLGFDPAYDSFWSNVPWIAVPFDVIEATFAKLNPEQARRLFPT